MNTTLKSQRSTNFFTPLRPGDFVTIKHLCGETRDVIIVSVQENTLTICWPMAGHYTIRLWAHPKSSSKAKATIGQLDRAPQWSLCNLEEVKSRVYSKAARAFSGR